MHGLYGIDQVVAFGLSSRVICICFGISMTYYVVF